MDEITLGKQLNEKIKQLENDNQKYREYIGFLEKTINDMFKDIESILKSDTPYDRVYYILNELKKTKLIK